MPTPGLDLAEMSSWDTDEVRSAVVAAMPPGWVFQFTARCPFRAVMSCGDQVYWEGFNYEERLILLDAYGYLALRLTSAPTIGPWASRRAELTSSSVQKQVLDLPDPGDLDPQELAAAFSTGDKPNVD